MSGSRNIAIFKKWKGKSKGYMLQCLPFSTTRATPFGVAAGSLAKIEMAGESNLTLLDASVVLGADRLDGTRGDALRAEFGRIARSIIVFLRLADLLFAAERCAGVAVAKDGPTWDVVVPWRKAI